MAEHAPVTVEIKGGPTISVRWREGMNVRQALEAAYDDQQGVGGGLTYALQYYGAELGYLVMMINENYDSFDVRYEPDFYWEMRVNGSASRSGIDQTLLKAGDVVTFAYEMRRDEPDLAPLTRIKHERRKGGARR